VKPIQNRDEWFAEKFGWLKTAFKVFLISLPFGILAAFVKMQIVRTICFIAFFIGFAWLLIMLCYIPIIHWKDRYAGQKTNLWGFFLVFETSGWSKIFYWFMHVLKDKNIDGPYSKLP